MTYNPDLHRRVQVSKHLVGRHEQDDHNPNRKRNPRLAEAGATHRRKDHRTKKQVERNKARFRTLVENPLKYAAGAAAAIVAAQVVGQMGEGVPADKAIKDTVKPYIDSIKSIKG